METTIQISVDNKLKESADSLFESLGYDTATVVRMFLVKATDMGGIPFQVSKQTDHSTKLGGWEGKIFVADNFNDPMDEFEEYM